MRPLAHLPQLAVLAVAALGAPGTAWADTAAPPSADRLIVRFEAGADTGDRTAAAAAVEGLVTAGPTAGTRLVDLPAGADAVAAAAELAEDPAVRWAQPDWIVHVERTPNDPYFPSTWGLTQVGAPLAWDVSTGSPSVTVAVVDSGIDASHPDLAANIAPGWDFVDGDADPSDLHGHGTHVAGTIGARGDDGVGVAGVAWGTRVMALRVLDGNGMGYSSNIAAAFDYAATHGARIVNASLGGTGRDLATEDAIARHPETLFVVAAGNDASDNDTSPVYPCNYPLPNVICVAATNIRDELAPFSNTGATTVHLAAPGVDVVSTFPGGNWATMSGTSMATPHVAGAAALLLAARPDLTAAAVRATLLDTADRLPSLAGRTVSGGRLNVARALTAGALSPTALTGAATVAGSTGTMTGGVDGRGQAATWAVEYGPSTAYGRLTAPVAFDGSAQAVTATVAGLTLGTTYHWRLRVTTAAGTAVGADGSFAVAVAVAVVPRRPTAQIVDPRCTLGVQGERCRRFRGSVAAWATLRGVVRDASGAALAPGTAVQVNVVRRDGNRCQAYDGRRFRALSCMRAEQVWVQAARAGGAWRLNVRGMKAGHHVFTARVAPTPGGGPLDSQVARRSLRLR